VESHESEPAGVTGVAPDAAVATNAIRAVLAIRDYRTLWSSTLGSLMGTWMQNVILAAFVYQTTASPVLTSLVAFSNLVPQLLFPTVGGALADLVDRKRLLLVLSAWQMLGSLAIAWIVRTPDFSRPTLFAAVFAVGVGAALENPLLLAVIPSLVPARLLSGAISLSSVSLNLSRVVGPAIGAMLYVAVGPSWVFVMNAATYLIVIVGAVTIRFPAVERRHGEGFAERYLGGFRFARRDPVVRRAITTILVFALCCSYFVPLLPAIAAEDWGVSSKSTTYGLLYATFGLGAIAGSLSVGTYLAPSSLERVLRIALVGFGLTLATWITVDRALLAFPIGFVLGAFHYAMITSITTIFQGRLDHATRGRVSAIWVMSMMGPVPLGALGAGWIAGHTSMNTVVYFSAAVAAGLAWYADLRPIPAPRSRP